MGPGNLIEDAGYDSYNDRFLNRFDNQVHSNSTFNQGHGFSRNMVIGYDGYGSISTTYDHASIFESISGDGSYYGGQTSNSVILGMKLESYAHWNQSHIYEGKLKNGGTIRHSTLEVLFLRAQRIIHR